MKINKNLILFFVTMIMSLLLFDVVYCQGGKELILTGDLYSYINNEYILEIPDMETLKGLEGRELGFKIKTTNNQNFVEEETEVLGVRCDSIKDNNNSGLIFRAIQNMLVSSDDNKYQTFRFESKKDESTYNEFISLLNNKLYNRSETVVVTYYDNRISGDSTVQTRVVYKIGKGKSNVSGDSSFFVFDNKSETENNDEKNLNQQKNGNIAKKVDRSEIINKLKNEDIAVIKLDENTKDTTVMKSLLEILMLEKNEKKIIVLEKYEGQKLVYRWTLPADSITKEENFDINIKTNSEEIEKIAKANFKHYKIIAFAQKGTLPVVGKVEVAMETGGLDLSKLKIFAVNLEKKEILEMKKEIKIENGMLVLEKIGYGDNYIIAN